MKSIIIAIAMLFACTTAMAQCPNCGDTYTASSNHWSYPGSINNHLTQDHGVDVSGMSVEQMLNLHDSLHGNSVRSSNVVVYSGPVVNTLKFFQQRKPVRSILVRPLKFFQERKPLRTALFGR